MRYYLHTLFFSFFICLSIKAQYSDVGLLGGFTFYQGDLSPEFDFKNLEVGTSKGALGGFYRYNYNRWINGKIQLMYGQASGNDKDSGHRRNLSFETDIIELGVFIELNLFGFDPFHEGKNFSPYAVIGLGGVYFNPKTVYNGRRVALQPLGTEGQGIPGYPDKYSRVNVIIPVGGGIKLGLGHNWTMNVEISARKVFTDYLDDISTTYAPYDLLLEHNGIEAAQLTNRTWELTGLSPAEVSSTNQRGNDQFGDWYYFITFGLTYHIPQNRITYRHGGKNLHCPRFKR